MKVDVYPNITNVEVYENPISVPVEATWEKVVFTVPDPVVASYDLGRKVATDRDGDYVIQLHYNATVQQYGTDFRLDGTNVVWISEVDLAVGEELIVWYSPQSAYGSVPGSGEVTSLTHLNDVTIEGPLAGDMLMRNADGQFVNRKLTAGANVTIVSDGDGVTISSVGGGGGAVVSASTITEGTVRLSTLAEAAGDSNLLAVTPAALQNQLATLSTVAETGQYNDLLGKPALSTVATSGSYNDLDNRPVIPNTQGAAGAVNVSDGNGGFSEVTWEVSNNHLLPTADDVYDIGSATQRVRDLYIGAQSIKIGDDNIPLGIDANGELTFGQTNVLTDANLADVATTGSYADLIGAPTLSGVATSGAYGDLIGAPTLSSVATTGSYADLIGAPTLSQVATTGAYADLSGAPTLSSVATTGSYADLIGAPTLSSVATSGAYADLSGRPTLSTVATSGSYNDLADKPTIPSASTDLTDSADLARLASPSLTGTPTAPTPALGDDSNKIATTAFVQDEITNLGGVNSLDDLSDVALSGTLSAGEVLRYDGANFIDAQLASTDLSDSADVARLASPSFTGTPTAPTANQGDNTNKIATTSYVQTEITNMSTVDALTDLTDVSLSGTLSGGEVLRYDGANFTDAQLDYSDLSGTPVIPDSSNDINSDHTGVNYTGALNASLTTHLSGIDTALGNLSVSSISVGNTSVDVTDTGTDGAITFNTEGTDRWEFNASGHLIPNGNANYDIGEAENKVRHFYLSNNSLKFGPSGDNTITGTVSASGDGLSYNGALLATQAFVSSNASNDLSGLTDVNLSGTLSSGEVLKYDGAGWVDAQLASTDLSDSNDLARTANLGTAASEDVGTAIGDVVQLVDVSGSASLPLVDASQLTGITASQVGALADITSESLNDLSDVDFTAGGTIDSYVLTYSDTNSRWEAQPAAGGPTTVLLSSSNITHAGSNHAFVTVSPNTNYIIDPSVASVQFVYRIYFTVAATGVDDPASVKIVNLSNLPIRVRSTSANVLYDSLGNAAPSYTHGGGGSGFYFEYNKGTVNLFQSDTTDAGATWYSYFDYAVENQSVPNEGDGIAYSEIDLANINIGQVFGDYVISADVNAAHIRAGRRYATKDTETVNRQINLPNAYQYSSRCDALDGRLLYIENRGSSRLRLQADNTNTGGNSALLAHLTNLDDTGEVTAVDLRAGESVAIRCERVNDNMYYRYIRQGFIPNRVTETINATSTISIGTEHHKVVYVNNGATAVTVTVPASNALRDGYQLTLKVLGTGAVTVNRSGTNTFDGDTSLTLGQNETLSLIESASGWAVLHNDAASGGATSLVTDTAPTLGGDLDVSTFDIVSSSGNDIEIAPDGAGALIVKGNATGGSGSITLNCEQNSHGVTIKSPPHASNATYTLTLPDDTGSANELLKTNGSGNLSWSAVDADEVVAPRAGTNYTALATDSVTTHLGAIDTALGNLGGGGGSAPSVTVLSGNATETLGAPSGTEEVYILAQGNVDVFMVSASSAGEGFKYHFKYTADGGYNFHPATINVNGSSSDTIDDGSSTYVDIANIYDALTLVSDGTSKWYII